MLGFLKAIGSDLDTGGVIDSVGKALADFPPNMLEKPGWKLTMHDEFDNPNLNENVWVPFYLRHRVKDSDARALYEIKNGSLFLMIKKNGNTVSGIQTLERPNLHKKGYRTDVPVSLKFTQKYGYFEIRAKTQVGSGHNSAFWLIGIQEKASQSGEIDVFEQPGNLGRYTYLSNVHAWKDNRMNRLFKKSGKIDWSGRHSQGPDLTSTFNIYAVDWEKNRIRMYFNNNLVREIPYSPNYEMGIVLSIYEGDNWWGKLDKSVQYPKCFIIDYLRVYERIKQQ